MSMVMNMSKEECAAYCDSLKCTPEQKAMCLKHAGSAFCTQACIDKCKEMNIPCDSKCKGACHEKCGDACISLCVNGKDHQSSCMEGCSHGCKTKTECMQSCGSKCASMHEEKETGCEHHEGAMKKDCCKKK